MARWILLREDGQHVSLGNYEPKPEELDGMAKSVRLTGFGGWVVEMAGVYYGRRKLTLTARHTLGAPSESWDAAVAAFLAIRKERTR